tara:strand:- start:95 stop:277 length:183 start_codon:yes stop_codon:yes gene_type:complete
VYLIQIINKFDKKKNGPSFFTGFGEDYVDLKAGMVAANEWIEKTKKPDDYEISYKIVGCL